MSAKQDISLLYEKEMQSKTNYIETPTGMLYNSITQLTAMCTAIINYLEDKKI